MKAETKAYQRRVLLGHLQALEGLRERMDDEHNALSRIEARINEIKDNLKEVE